MPMNTSEPSTLVGSESRQIQAVAAGASLPPRPRPAQGHLVDPEERHGGDVIDVMEVSDEENGQEPTQPPSLDQIILENLTHADEAAKQRKSRQIGNRKRRRPKSLEQKLESGFWYYDNLVKAFLCGASAGNPARYDCVG